MAADAAAPSLTSSLRSLRSLLARMPGTVTLTVVILLVGVLTGALWESATETGLVETWGWGLEAFSEGRVWTILAGATIAPEPWMYGLILALFCVGGGYLELTYGTVRMLVAVLGTHVGAVVATALFLLAMESFGVEWAGELARVSDGGFSNAGFGAVGAATAGMALLWRRRVRLILSLYLLAMVLYSAEIWDFSHAAAFWIGCAIGPWVVGRAREPFDLRFGIQEARDVSAILLAFGGLHQLLSRVWPGEGGIVSFGHPEDDPSLTTLGLVGTSVLTLALAYSLHRGRRVAWWIVVLGTALGGFVALFGLSGASAWLDLILDLAVLAILLARPRAFAVKGERSTRVRIWRRGAIAIAALWTFTVIAIMGLSHQITPEPHLGDAMLEATLRIVGLSSGLEGTTTLARTLLSGIGLVWFVTFLLWALGALLVSRRHRTAEPQRDRYLELQHQTASMTSIGYMTRWDGIELWVTDDGTAGLGFAQIGNTVIVLSDPVGAADAVERAYDEFREFCRSRGWRAAYFGISEQSRAALEARGWRTVQVAEDTVIPLPELAFTGKAWQDVRSAINRAKREGVTMRTLRFADAPRGVKDQLEAISAQWAGDKSLPEMGFTLGDLKEAEDPNVVMRVAVDADGTVHGMTSWLPVYREGDVVGWTIDIMKRRLDQGVMSGVMEFLIAEAAIELKEAGYERISLSAAPLSYSGEVDGAIERMLEVLADKAEPYYGFTTLERFKAKFKPEHHALYLAYADEAHLPGIVLAILRAYLPDASATDLMRAAASRPE